jgi:hypothetical protein
MRLAFGMGNRPLSADFLFETTRRAFQSNDMHCAEVRSPKPGQFGRVESSTNPNAKATCGALQLTLSGGGGNCTRVPNNARSFHQDTCRKSHLGLSELCRDDVALQELVASWRHLTSDVRVTIMEIARGGRSRCD